MADAAKGGSLLSSGWEFHRHVLPQALGGAGQDGLLLLDMPSRASGDQSAEVAWFLECGVERRSADAFEQISGVASDEDALPGSVHVDQADREPAQDRRQEAVPLPDHCRWIACGPGR